MIDIEEVSFRYAQGESEAGLERITLRVRAGEVVVLTGGSGCGKTTLTRLVNGLIPHYHPGELTGSAKVAGIEVAQVPLHRTAAVVGSVFQNPRSQFFTTDAASELAFGAENLGHPVPSILTAVERSATELGLTGLLPRSIFELSGGEKQKVACGSVWVTGPRVLVLDEPSSNLDAATIDDLARLVGRWKAEGCAVLVAEHRLSWLQGLADRWLLMEEGRIVEELDAATMAGMDAAAAAARGLRSPQPVGIQAGPESSGDTERIELVGFRRAFAGRELPAVEVERLRLPRNGVIAVTGSNGAGKSTLIRALVGLDRKAEGVLRIDGAEWGPKQRLAASYLVMQDVNHQLFAESVLDEVLISAPGIDDEQARAVLGSLDLLGVADRHPMSLSGGQKQRVAIASALASGKQVLVFDEPTSGLDRRHMAEVSACLRELSDQGCLVIVVTHDTELITACCTHLVRLEQGRVVASHPLRVPG